MNHNRADWEARGYVYTGRHQPTQPTYGEMRRALIELDLTWGSLMVLRVDGNWEFLKTPSASSGFVDEPLMGGTT